MFRAGGSPLVGVGEPPAESLGALVYLSTGGEDAGGTGSWTVDEFRDATLALQEALGGQATVRVLVEATADEVALRAHLDALKAAGVAPVVEREDPGLPSAIHHFTADTGGMHRRMAPGRPAATPALAVEQWRRVASYGLGHAEPLFEPDGSGGQRQVRVSTWDDPTAAYACPFPTRPGHPSPAGSAVEIGVAEGRTVPEEAIATWCDLAARGLLRECDPDELAGAFRDGEHAVVEFGAPPGPGLWWLRPEGVAPPGGMSGDPCIGTALDPLEVAADHAGLTLHVGLTDDDVEAGCRRERLESCRQE